MKNLVVYPQFFKSVSNGFGLIGLHRVENIIKALEESDEVKLTENLFVTEEDDYSYYSIYASNKRMSNGEFDRLLVINEQNLIPLNKLKSKFIFSEIPTSKGKLKYVEIVVSNGVTMTLFIDELKEWFNENNWRLNFSPKIFFDSEAMNSENLILPYTMLHAPSDLMKNNFIYFLMNEFFNSEMLNQLSEKMNDRWLADCENDEYYDEDLMKIKIADMVASLTCSNGGVLLLEFGNPNIHNPKGYLVVTITHNNKDYNYMVTDFCDSEIHQLRDTFLSKVNK